MTISFFIVKFPIMQPFETTLNQIPTPRIERWVYAFIVLHIIVWTLAPICIRYTLPMDAIEGTIWSRQLEWGYDKHPFLNGWLIALALKLDGFTGWGIYLFSQLSVALCFWAVWQFGKKIFPPLYAFIAVLLLESMQYYNLHAIDFNNNNLEPGFWSLTVLFFYLGLRENKLYQWLLTGFFAGLSMLTKYYAVMLFVPMIFFMLLYPNTRAQFKKGNLYLGLLTFLLVIAPHAFWVFSHDFITFGYALNRISDTHSWFNHIFYPAQFTWQQFEVFIPALIVLSMLFIGKTNNKIAAPVSINQYDKTFLLVIALGPFLLTLLPSILTGSKLRAAWGQPLLTYWGLLFIAWFMPILTRERLRRFVIFSLALLAATAAGYCICLIRAPEPSSANFPGKNIATTLTQEWHTKFSSKLAYVVGSRELGGNIAFHSKDHPLVFIEANKKISPWINEQKLRQKGAIFVWDPTDHYQMSFDELKAQFPALEQPHVMHFAWMRNAKMKPVEIRVAYLMPEINA